MKNINTSLWNNNHPRHFWQCQPDFSDQIWETAIANAKLVLGLPETTTIDSILELTLGEGQFGDDRYRLSLARRTYYQLKALLPRALIRIMRQVYNKAQTPESFRLHWPVETRYAQFQWGVLRQVLLLTGKKEIAFSSLWPNGHKFAFALTHDIETSDGQRLSPVLADMEEKLGFRSVFNFVAERYPLDRGLMQDLRQRGFEIGVHGLKHDGKLFNSSDLFNQRAAKINHYLKDFQAVGFRSPLTHRNPQWMQTLEMEYDLSFFDTDPFEPMPGGVMNIWPFVMGRFIELPYTLPQDFTLYHVMGETTPRIWLEKVDFLEQYHGLALVIVHPDYSATGPSRQIYQQFLNEMKARENYWHALPRDVADWWRKRTSPEMNPPGTDAFRTWAQMDAETIHLLPAKVPDQSEFESQNTV